MRRALLVGIAAACSVTSEPKSFAVPSDEDFPRVSAMLQARCGSLDCHGQPGRNLRLYGEPGLRLGASDVPGGVQTSAAEHAANYASVLALEPEILAAVARDGGRDLERLTLVRKARDAEEHAGGNALDESADRCLVSWLSGGPVDAQACFDGSVLQKPAGFDSGGAAGVGGSGGVGGTGASGGSAGAGATGGTGAAGGAGGTGGSGASGGAGGSGGVVCTPGGYWPCTYDAACVPLATAPPDHDAYVQVECLSCHVAGGAAGPGQEFLFGGVAKNPYDGTGAPQIEVGVRDGDLFYYACTDERGFFFVPALGNPEPNWENVETRMRALLGSKIMPEDKEHKPTCNEPDCHAHPEHPLLAPL